MSVFEGCEPILRLKVFTRRDSLSGMLVIKWWEHRRLAYNAIVGSTGIVACGICLIAAFISSKMSGAQIGWPDGGAFVVIVLYGIAANVCYTGGWLAELIVGAIWRHRAGAFGESAFFAGVLFSIGVTLTPVVFVLFILLVQAVFGGK